MTECAMPMHDDIAVEPEKTGELPGILKLALEDQEAVEMVQRTGIRINVNELNTIPIGGRIRYAQENWAAIAPRNDMIAKIVSEGYKLDFISEPQLPINMGNPHTDPEGQEVLDKEVDSMLKKGVIRSIGDNTDGAVSPFHARPKPRQHLESGGPYFL